MQVNILYTSFDREKRGILRLYDLPGLVLQTHELHLLVFGKCRGKHTDVPLAWKSLAHAISLGNHLKIGILCVYMHDGSCLL